MFTTIPGLVMVLLTALQMLQTGYVAVVAVYRKKRSAK